MQPAVDMKRRLEGVFPKKQAGLLAEVITDAYCELVKTSDFNELKRVSLKSLQVRRRTLLRPKGGLRKR